MKTYHLIIATAILLILNSLKIHATPPDWDPPTNLQFNMQIVARLTAIDGTFSEVEADLVAAFVGDECRGLASPIADVDGLVFLTVGSNMHFRRNHHLQSLVLGNRAGGRSERNY
jgi:hypothetical protein